MKTTTRPARKQNRDEQEKHVLQLMGGQRREEERKRGGRTRKKMSEGEGADGTLEGGGVEHLGRPAQEPWR